MRGGEEEIIEVLSKDFEDQGRYRDMKNPIATTWLISFDQILRQDQLAAEYLSFMSCLVSERHSEISSAAQRNLQIKLLRQ